MSIGVYIRVSSQGQKADSQRAEIQRWLEAHGHTLDAVQWFEDRETGATMHRSGFIRLQEAIFAGTVKTVIVWKLDRIARSMREGINTLSRWCECGVRVVSVTQQIDLSGTVGHLVAGVLFAVAEIELEHVKERQAAGVALAKQRGAYKGRKPGTTKANPQRARELRKKGMTLPEIAQAQGVNKRTISRYLKRDSA
jgi:DNA invertase Pin-like site-specific DNA recombinase